MFIFLPLLSVLAGFFVVLSIYHVWEKFFSRRGLPKELQWVGTHDDGYLTRARVTFKTLFGTRDLVLEGYNKYSKFGVPFVLPNIATGPEVLVPLSYMNWLLSQPDNVLSQGEVNNQFLQAYYTLLHPKVISDNVHGGVIHKELTTNLGDLINVLMDEMELSFEKHWGTNTKEWIEVPAYTSITDIISRMSNRALVGVDLCRNEDYVKNVTNFARLVVVESCFVSMVPNLLKPLFAPLITWFDYQNHRRCTKYTVPLIKQRLAALSAPDYDEKKKNDYIQWSIDHSFANNDSSERTLDLISKRLSVLSFATIQSSAITATNLLFDLASTPTLPSLFSLFRTEIESSLSTTNGLWTKATIAKLISIDSTIRESMRLWGFVSRGCLKEVVAKKGVHMPNGMCLPKGVKVGVHGYPINHDEDLYHDAWGFNPLRFVNVVEGELGKSEVKVEAKKGCSLVSTSEKFMGFSHGRHACPGRFFAAQQLKLVLAHIAQNYDLEPTLPSRPDNRWLVGSQGPPLKATIRVRRREGTV